MPATVSSNPFMSKRELVVPIETITESGMTFDAASRSVVDELAGLMVRVVPPQALPVLLSTQMPELSWMLAPVPVLTIGALIVRVLAVLEKKPCVPATSLMLPEPIALI